MESEKKEISNICIIYHYPCYDGSYAALNCYLYYCYFYKKENNVYFYPSNSQNRIEEVLTEENCKFFNKVYIVDKGMNDEDYEYVSKKLSQFLNLKLFYIDHHISSLQLFNNHIEKFKPLKNYKQILDDKAERAACGLSFDYFKNKSLKYYKAEEVEKFFTNDYKLLNEYVEDSDIGLFKMKYTHEFKSGLSCFLTPLKSLGDFQYSQKNLDYFLNIDVKSCIRKGEKSYKKYKKNSVSEISGKNCYIVELKNSNNPSESWKFIICWAINKQYRNHACPILSEISYSKGMSAIGGFVYHCEKNVNNFY